MSEKNKAKIIIKQKRKYEHILSMLNNFMRKLVAFIIYLNFKIKFVLNPNHSRIYNSTNPFFSSSIKGNIAIV